MIRKHTDYNQNRTPKAKKARTAKTSDEVQNLNATLTNSEEIHPPLNKRRRLSIEATIQCNFCQTRLANESLLDDHIASEHQGRVKKVRKRPTKTVHRLAENMDLINLKLVYKNEYWLSTVQPDLKQKRFKCLRCIQTFDSRKDLHRHMDQSKSPENLFVCQICQERSGSKEDLIYHISHHHLPKHLRCQLCRHLTEYCTVKHLDYIYSTLDNNFDCTVCFKDFGKLSDLKLHLEN
jgi:hypothetical protein